MLMFKMKVMQKTFFFFREGDLSYVLLLSVIYKMENKW